MFKDSYKRRHVVLNGEQSLGALVYYKDAKDTRPKGSIDILDAEIREEGPGPVSVYECACECVCVCILWYDRSTYSMRKYARSVNVSVRVCECVCVCVFVCV